MSQDLSVSLMIQLKRRTVAQLIRRVWIIKSNHNGELSLHCWILQPTQWLFLQQWFFLVVLTTRAGWLLHDLWSNWTGHQSYSQQTVYRLLLLLMFENSNIFWKAGGSPVLLLDEGWDAYPELVEDAVWAPSLKESQMFTFVTIASSNRGLNLQKVPYQSQNHTWCIRFSSFPHMHRQSKMLSSISLLPYSFLFDFSQE